jgi:hypothetical protein
MDTGFSEEIAPMNTTPDENITKHIHEGRYAAEVEVTLHYSGTDWDPTIDLPDIQKLERVRLALRRGDIAAAAKEAKVFELLPLAGE